MLFTSKAGSKGEIFCTVCQESNGNVLYEFNSGCRSPKRWSIHHVLFFAFCGLPTYTEY